MLECMLLVIQIVEKGGCLVFFLMLFFVFFEYMVLFRKVLEKKEIKVLIEKQEVL